MISDTDGDKATKESRIARHARLAREAWDEPSSMLRWSRSWLVSLWITKGGGFYGLGYVIAFVSLELKALSGDLSGGNGLVDVISSQIFDFIIQFSITSFFNAFMAVIWPFLLLLWQPVAGLILLIGAWLLYRAVVYPSLEAWFPEIKVAREAKAASDQAGHR